MLAKLATSLGLACLLGNVGLARADLSLEQAVQAALADSAHLRAQEEDHSAAQQALTASGTLPDPRLYGGLSNIPVSSMGGVNAYSSGQDAMSARVIGISQDLPNTAKRQAARDQAQADAELSSADITQARSDLAIAAAQAWIALHAEEQRRQLLLRQRQDGLLLVQLSARQVAVGQAAPVDALQARLDLADLDNALAQNLAAVAIRRARLVRLIGAAGQAPLCGTVPAWPLQDADLRQRLAQHPDLQVAAAKVRQAAADVAAASANQHPDWGVDLAYQHRGPAYADMMSLTVSMSLPVFQGQRQGPRLKAQESRLLAARDDLLDLQREHVAQLQADLSLWQALNTQVTRLRQEELPLAQQKIDLLLASYRNGQGDIATLLAARQARRRLLLQAIDLDEQRTQLSARLHYQGYSPEQGS